MEKFDLDQHYARAREAVTEEKMNELRSEFDSYYAPLSKEEQDIFVLRLREHVREEVIRTKALIEFVKDIMNAEHQAV